MRHLRQLDHKKIAYIGGSPGPTISDHRYDAFIDAMEKNGLKARPEYVRPGNYRIPGGEAAMKELLALSDRPTAVLTANDLIAIGALRAIHHHGLKVPHDISVVGFDDIELSDLLYPPLTTLRLPRNELAGIFFKALESARCDPHVPGQQYSIATSLVVRGSTGKANSR